MAPGEWLASVEALIFSRRALILQLLRLTMIIDLFMNPDSVHIDAKASCECFLSFLVWILIFGEPALQRVFLFVRIVTRKPLSPKTFWKR